MPTEIKIEGLDKFKKLGGVFAAARAKFLSGLEKAAKSFSLDAVRIAKDKYLSGPRSATRLGVISNRLRSSVGQSVTRDGDNFEIGIGTNVEYAAIWELGFHGTINVPAHVRVVNKVFGRATKTTVSSVRAHQRRIDQGGRPFLGPAIEEALPYLSNSIERLLSEIVMPGEPGEGAGAAVSQ